jgi:hypothetical protein
MDTECSTTDYDFLTLDDGLGTAPTTYNCNEKIVGTKVKHGGKITWKSDGYSHGTGFVVCLDPSAEELAAAAKAVVDEAAADKAAADKAAADKAAADQAAAEKAAADQAAAEKAAADVQAAADAEAAKAAADKAAAEKAAADAEAAKAAAEKAAADQAAAEKAAADVQAAADAEAAKAAADKAAAEKAAADAEAAKPICDPLECPNWACGRWCACFDKYPHWTAFYKSKSGLDSVHITSVCPDFDVCDCPNAI